MTTLINQTLFQPHLLEGRDQACLTNLPFKTILELTTRHKIVLLRGFNPLEKQQLVEYCEDSVPLLYWDFGPVMEMKVDKTPKNYLFTEGDVPLHWDGAFYHEPRFLLFHCLQAPAPGSGGETLFVNTEQVWQAASPEQKTAWKQYYLSFKTEKLAHYGGSITRQLVNQHPDTGEHILRFAEPVGEHYLNPVDVAVLGESEQQTASILSDLSSIMRQPEHCYQHCWQPGDLLIADNFSLLHGRNAFQQYSPRHLRRIQIL